MSADGRLSPIPLRLAYATDWPTRFVRIKPVVTSMEFGPSFGRMSVEAKREQRARRCEGWSTSASRGSVQAKGILFAIDEAQSASIEELAALAVLYQQVLGDQDATGLSDSDQRGLALVFAGLPSMVDDLLEEPSVTFCGVPSSVRWGRYLCQVRDSYIQTVKDAGLYVDAETADLADKGMGHPYMVQLVGYYMWRSAVRRGSTGHRKARCRGWPCGCRLRVL